MKSTKFIKLPISKKQIDQTLTCVNKDGKMAVGLIHQSRLDYSFTCISEINGNKSYMYDVEFYLIEVEDKANEMVQKLKEFLSAIDDDKITYDVTADEWDNCVKTFYTETKDLIKEASK